MIRRIAMVSVAAITLSTSIGVAQTPNPTLQSALSTRRAATELAGPYAVYEDIEIMRRLLAGKFAARDSSFGTAGTLSYLRFINQQGVRQNLYPNNLYGSANPHGEIDGSGRVAIPSIDGVYLQGKGVVLTMNLPASHRDPVKSTSQPAAKPVSDWDRTRQQLRGDVSEPIAKSEPPTPSTADVILAVLAENGKHIHIADNEDVFVVVTFRGASSAQVANAYPAWGYQDVPVTGAAPPTNDPLVSVPAGGIPSGHGQTARDYLLLGDLHLRQQQYNQALESFQKAIALEPNADPKQLAETFRKLAETKLRSGQLDEAKAMIESAAAWEKKSKEITADKPKTDATTSKSPRWPTKLIITANKRQLDDVGAGKLSMDDFRKNAKIELVTPPNAK